MWLILLTAMVTGVMPSDLVSHFRSPVRGYVRNAQNEQAVLIEPEVKLPPLLLQHQLSGTSAKNNINKDVPRIPDSISHLQDDGEEEKVPSVLAQKLSMRRPLLPGYPKNNSNPLESRLRQKLTGRTGMWRKSNRRRRPGLSRLRSGGNRRRRPMGSLTGTNHWRNAPGILHNRLAIPTGVEAMVTTLKPSVEDFLSHWHNIYSRSQTKAQDTTVEQTRIITEAPKREDLITYTPKTASVSLSSDNGFGSIKTNQKGTQKMSPKHPYVTRLASVASIPSVHDMTSMHFKKKSNFTSSASTNEKNGSSKVKVSKYSNRPAIRAEGITRPTSASIRTTPLPPKQSVTKPTHEGKHILGSIQSIFQAAKSDEHELSSLKNINQGNTSPQLLDIFSGVTPTYGFVPSEQVQPGLGLGIDAIRSQVKDSYVTPRDSSHQNMMITTSRPQVELEPQNILISSPKPFTTNPTLHDMWMMGQNLHTPEVRPQNLWVTSERPFMSNFESKTNSIKPSALLSQQPVEDHIILYVGQSVPVHTEPAWSPEHRGGSEGDIILNEGPSDDVIVGRPAALIQVPPEDETVVITAPPNLQSTHNGNPPQSFTRFSNPIQPQKQFENHPQPLNPTYSQTQFVSPPESHTLFANQYPSRTEVLGAQLASVAPSLSYLQSEEIEPLVEFIKEKYDSQHIKTVPPSVTSLQSIINSGRIPEFFRKGEVLDLIRKDRIRNRNSAINRMANPLRNSVDKIGVHPKEKSDVGGSGQFVALSSLALVAALCGYILYSASGAAREARKVLHPLKEAVHEAKEGLHMLLQGLDEYEEHLIEEEEEEEEEGVKEDFQHIPVQNTTQDDVPTILTRIWNTVVPAEVKISSRILEHFTGGSSLVRRNGPRQTRTGFRQPHAIGGPTNYKNEEINFDPFVNKTVAYLNESLIQPTAGLVSVANSFFNSLINRKTIESVISQLKSPLGSSENISSEESEPLVDEIDRLNLEETESNFNKTFSNETIFDEQSITNEKQPQDMEINTTVTVSFEDAETLTTEEPFQNEGLVTFMSIGLQEDEIYDMTDPHQDKSIIQEGIHKLSRGSDHDTTSTLRKIILEVSEDQEQVFHEGSHKDFHETEGTQEKDLHDSEGDGMSEVTTTEVPDEDFRESTVTPPTVQRRVILNNRLHIQHNPETDPPRTSVFVNNVPLKSISPDS